MDYTELAHHRPWPSHITGLRPWQEVAIAEVMAAYDNGAKVVFLEAPTGAGKTIIGEGVRRAVGLRMGREARAVFTCSTKTLQDQVAEDFDYARVLKGRTNYTPLSVNPDTWPRVDCSDCDAERPDPEADPICTHCDPVWLCPYRVAKREAEQSVLPVLNTAYLLTVMRHMGLYGTDMDLHIVDEADLLPDTLCSFVGTKVQASWTRDCEISPPSNVSDVDRLQALLPAWLDDAQARLDIYADNPKHDDKARDKIKACASALRGIKTDCEAGVHWIVEGVNAKNKRDYPALELLSVHSRPVAYGFTDHINRALVMSATLLSPELMALDLDLQPGEWAAVNVPAPFAAERRPVVAPKLLALSKKVLDEGMPAPTQDAFAEVLNRHESERVLVHVPSYHLADTVTSLVSEVQPGRQRFTYTNSFDREAAIGKWLASDDGVFIAPSLKRGLDLKGDACRAQVIFKLDIANLGAPMTKARLYVSSGTPKAHIGTAGNDWMALYTIRELVQACGRVMRSSNDHGVTYVLDGHMARLYSTHKGLFPQWFKDAIAVPGTKSGNALIGQYEAIASNR